MHQLFQKYLSTVKMLCPSVTEEALSFLEQGLTISNLDRGQYYIKAGFMQTSVGFVTKGLLRSFYIDSNGKEITLRFITDNDFATNYVSFIDLKPSSLNIQCLEPCELINISHTHMQESYRRYSDLERYGRLIAEEVIKQHQSRIASFLFETAEERYLKFIQSSPDLYTRISVSHLASYIGVERQSLTRIRKKVIQS